MSSVRSSNDPSLSSPEIVYVPDGAENPARVESGVHMVEGIIDVAGGAIAVYGVADNIIGAVQAKTNKERLLKSTKATLSAGSAAGAAGGVTTSLEKLGLIARAAAAWTSALGYILLPFQAIGLAFNSYDVVQSGKRLYKLNAINPEGMRGQRLLLGLEHVKATDKERVEAIMARIKRDQSEKSLQAGEKLLSELKTRVKKELAIAVASTALGVIGVALGVFATVATFGIAPLALGIAASLVGIGVSLYKYCHQKEVADKLAERRLEDRIRAEVRKEMAEENKISS